MKKSNKRKAKSAKTKKNKNKVRTVVYLSDKDPNYKILEDYIGREFFGRNHDLPVFLEENARNNSLYWANVMKKSEMEFAERGIISAVSKQLTANNVLPTRYDSFGYTYIINHILFIIRYHYPDFKKVESLLPIIANIPTGRVNALAIHLEGATKKFILFDSQIFKYCHFFCRAMFFCLKPYIDGDFRGFSFKPQDMADFVNQDDRGLHHLVDLLYAQTVEGSNFELGGHAFSLEHQKIVGNFRTTMEMFIFAHELGHIQSNHLDGGVGKEGFAEMFSPLAENENQAKEIEADVKAHFFVLNVLLRSEGLLNIFTAIYLYWYAMDFYMRSQHLSMHGNLDNYPEDSDTHPHLITRRVITRGMFKRWITPMNEDCNLESEHFDDIDLTMESIWDAIEPELLKKYKSI